jgi:hypothetical protein
VGVGFLSARALVYGESQKSLTLIGFGMMLLIAVLGFLTVVFTAVLGVAAWQLADKAMQSEDESVPTEVAPEPSVAVDS